ncbi:hypothetical protein [Streptomyces sp. NBC_01233]|uniref:hypothetical protein n=1 Tax=Streptomyces sp. NBC_01233 TaxID=2903787 RepID=UPI002E10005C|nr:hypothetical protein OG332_06945 [Streptomyces sp. NBC_01233]
MALGDNTGGRGKVLFFVDLCAAVIMAVLTAIFAARGEWMLTAGFAMAALGCLFTAAFRRRTRHG